MSVYGTEWRERGYGLGGATPTLFHSIYSTLSTRVTLPPPPPPQQNYRENATCTHGRRNYYDTNPLTSSLLVFNRVYRLEIQSVMLVFATPLGNCCPSTFSLTSPTPPPKVPKVKVQYIQTVCGCGRGDGTGGIELCCRPYSAGV
jgi:hypothetical protein